MNSKILGILIFAAFLFLLLLPVSAQETWTSLGLSGMGAGCAAVAPGNSNLILVGGSNLYVSSDGGSTWTTKSNVNSVWSVAFGSNQNVAFASTWGYGIFKSTDGGATWVSKNNGITNGVVKSIAVSPADDSIVYACAENGFCISTDGGENWMYLMTGINASAVLVKPSDPQTIYLGTWGSGVYKTTDGGMTWNKLTVSTVPDYLSCYGFAVDPVNNDIVYVVYQEGGVLVSFDGGANWSWMNPGFEGFAVATDKSRGGFVYGLGGWTYPQRSGCYGATSWQPMSSGWSTSWFARFITVDPNDPSKIYACSGNGSFCRWIADISAPSGAGTLTASSSGSGIKLTWSQSASSDCAGYWIYRRESGGSYAITPYASVTGGATTTYTDINVTAGKTYYYKVAAYDAAQNRSTLSNEASAVVTASIDLDVTYISRLPRDTYFYWVDYPNNVPNLRPGTENQKRWPNYGETVTFQAHFINKGTANSGPANYRWKVNGVVIGTGTAASLAPGQEGTATIDWVWNVSGIDTDHSDQTVTFEIDYDNLIAETYEQNNSLTDFLEGCSLYIYVEKPIYDAFNARVNLVGTYSFEDWIQRQIKAMNDNFARSKYPPLAPNGCLERVRIDKIVVGSMPGTSDGTCDGRWAFTGDPNYATYADRVDGGLIHELMHQLGIIDLYQMPVLAGGNRVITPDGLPVGYTYSFARPGIMGGGDIAPYTSGASQTMPEYCSSHDVMGLNRNCGYRRGYYGEYLFDIPRYNYILVKDSSGAPAAGVTIKVYQASFGDMSGTPVITTTTDSNGIALLTNRPVIQQITTATGHTLRPNPFGTINVVGGDSTILIEMSRPGGDFDYKFMNVIDFNMAYWSGNTESWTYTINSRLASNSLPRITQLAGAIESNKVVLTWPAVPGAVSYRIYRAGSYLNRPDDPNHIYENWVFKLLASTTSTTYTDTTRFESCRYAVASVDSSGKESALSNRVFAPNLINPWAVGVLSDDTRVILDPQNGYAYMRQTPTGIYIGNTGSVHNHVENSKFMAIDRRLSRMLTSHPSDWYGGPHSIRISDLEGSLNGLWDLGTQGTGNGQFNNPGGVAVDDESRIYAVDTGNNRIQIFTSSGSFLLAYGSTGTGAGKFNNPQGIAVDSQYKIYVCDKSNARVQILQYDKNANTVTYLGLLTGKTLNGPTGVAIAPSGRIYVTDSNANRVEEYSASGKWLRSYTAPDAPYSGSFSSPTGIAVDSTGKVIVCDTNNRRVVTITPAASTTANAARKIANGQSVRLDRAVVTAKFPGYFYVQDVGALPGIRVVSSTAVEVGQTVDVYGTMATTNGEREINATLVDVRGTASEQPKPYGMTIRSMGGAADGIVPGITGGYGLNNVGLLMKVFGKTSQRNPAASEFYLDDGSGVKVRVYAPGLTIPADGSSVLVTGVSGAETSGSNIVRVLRARSIQ